MQATLSRRPAEPPNLPTVDYPDEVVERWKKISEITRQQIATGELKPMTVEELAAMYGIDIDD